MTTVALDRVLFVHPLGDMGDRNLQGQSTAIASEAWHIEADYHRGNIGDVTLYRNKNLHDKSALPDWEWYAAVPTANIKAYKLAGVLPKPETLVHGEPKAPTAPAASVAHASAKS